jgi:hypothetical protein
LIDPHLIFKRLRSDNEAERMVAANKLYENFTKDGGHPDDWEIHKKGNGANPLDAKLHRAVNDARMAEMERQLEEDQRKRAEAAVAKERKAREKADVENAKLREQLNRAKERAKNAPNPNERVDILSGLLSQAAVSELSAEQIGEKMQTLHSERDRRQHNVTAQIDLVIGQLTSALYQRYEEQFGKWRRGSGAPKITEFLETHAGKSASWCRRCFKAYSIIVTADNWDATCWDGTGGVEGIIKAAADPNRPKVKRVSKVQQKLASLTDVVRRRDWGYAERMVSDWDTE